MYHIVWFILASTTSNW